MGYKEVENPYWVFYFPYWRCSRCGRRYTSLEDKCMFCREKAKTDSLPPRHQYREIPQQKVGRTYYESDINIDYWRCEYEERGRNCR